MFGPPQLVQEGTARAVGSMLSGLLSCYPTNQHDACADVHALGKGQPLGWESWVMLAAMPASLLTAMPPAPWRLRQAAALFASLAGLAAKGL